MDKHSKPNAIRWIVGLGSLGLAVFFSVLGGFALEQQESHWSLQITRQHERQILALRNSQQELQQQAQLLAETIAADAWLVELVRQAYALEQGQQPDEQRLSAISSQLQTRLTPRWRNLQSARPFELYVHLAPRANVLLSVHQPQSLAAVATPQRRMVLDSLSQSATTTGLVADKHNLSIHAVVPLHVESLAGRLNVGALEVSLRMPSDLQALGDEINDGVALLLKRSTHMPGSSSEHLRMRAADGDDWQLAGTPNLQLQTWHTQQRLPDPEAGNTFTLMSDEGRTYLLNQIRMRDYQSGISPVDSAIRVLTWRDISALVDQHVRDQRWLIIKWLLAWLAAEALLLMLLQATRLSGQKVMRRHHAELQHRHQQTADANQLLGLISEVQAAYINQHNQREAFETLLKRILEVSASQFGFVGEILRDDADAPYLRTFAISNIAWDADTRAFYETHATQGLEFRNLDSLFGQVIRSGQPLIANDPANHPKRAGLPPGHPPLLAFAGLPIHSNGELLGMLGLANRTGGYSSSFTTQLQPLLTALGQLLYALRRDNQRALAQQRTERQQAAVRALNEIASLPNPGTQEQLRQALQLGAAFFGMPIGIISQIETQAYQVMVHISPPDSLQDGQQFVLGDTYCSIALQGSEHEILAIAAMGESEHAAHP
ncbi:MAG: GAF domain-containing protein, partial [Pseudomonas sp.]|nr:GAF domain-containing protein [Pseudomonas sp.]